MLKLAAPSEDVGTGDRSKLIGRMDAEEAAEVLNVALVGAPSTRVVQVGKPLGCCRYLSQTLELVGRESALSECNAKGEARSGEQIIHSETFSQRLREAWFGKH